MATVNGHEDTLTELIAAKQLKQALILCEKRLKKAPQNEDLLVIRIKILLNWRDAGRFQQGLNHLEGLLARKPPVTDLDALRVLDEIFNFIERTGYHLIPTQLQTWQRAASSQPNDENLYTVWHRSKFDARDFKGAQQACSTWMRNFPKDRKPFFLYILNTHLISEQTNDPQEKSLMQKLAHRYLSKAATDIPEFNGEMSTSGRHIQTHEDRCLMLRVYRAQADYKGAAEMIMDRQIGLWTLPPREKWEFATQFMDLQELQEDWAGLWNTCSVILQESHSSFSGMPKYDFGKLGDDWKTWEMLIRANNYKSTNVSSSMEHTIRSHFAHLTTTAGRNARLALLLFYSVEVFEGRKSQSDLVTILTDYFHNFSVKTSCFLDLKSWLSYLDESAQKQLLLDATEFCQDLKPKPEDPESSIIFWITAEINLLKLEYHLVISQDRNSHRADLLTAFVSNCLRLYKESLQFEFDLPVSDRRPGDDAGLLAAMALVRLFKTGKKSALLHSIIVLEHILLYSRHNYDVLLIAVRLYMFLGAGSRAIDRYTALSIKNIQLATISWVLYTRLSTIHPYPVTYRPGEKGQTFIDPIEDMSHALHWHKSAQDLSQKALHSMQTQGHWNMSLDTLETNRVVFEGFARCLFLAESKRIERFSSPYKAVVKTHVAIPDCTRDTRDRCAFPDYEGGGFTFEQHLPMAGTSTDPNDSWLQHQLLLACFWDLLQNESSDFNENDLGIMAERSEANQDAFTAAEHGTANVVKVLLRLYYLYFLPHQYEKPAVADFIDQALDYLGTWLTKSNEVLTSSTTSGTYASISLAPDLQIPLWSLYHELFSHLEQCIFISATLKFISTENKKQPIVDHQKLELAVTAVLDECTNLSQAVCRRASALQGKLRGQTFLQRLNEIALGGSVEGADEDPVAKDLRDLNHHSVMKKVCRDLRDSWVEGLEGVVRTKLA